MEIKLNLQLQTILNWIHFLENVELESVVLSVIGTLLTPCVMFALWSLGIAALYQMFWLGVKAGIIVFVVCALYLAFLKFSNMATTTAGLATGPPKCTLLDIILSVLFQANLRIPTFIWDRLVSDVWYGGKSMEQPHMSKWDQAWARALCGDKQKRAPPPAAAQQPQPQPCFRASMDANDAMSDFSDLVKPEVNTDLQFLPLSDFEYGVWDWEKDCHPPQRASSDEEIVKQILFSPPPPAVEQGSPFAATCSTAPVAPEAATTRRRRGPTKAATRTRKNRAARLADLQSMP